MVLGEPVARVTQALGDLRIWRSRSGTVKVNLALSELPDFVADPGTRVQPHHTGAIELAHSLEYLETAFQEARSGQAAARPFSDGCIPSTFDRTICPEGTHIMSLFTQWVPAEWAAEPHRDELEAYADRVVDGYTELAPTSGRTCGSAVSQASTTSLALRPVWSATCASAASRWCVPGWSKSSGSGRPHCSASSA